MHFHAMQLNQQVKTKYTHKQNMLTNIFTHLEKIICASRMPPMSPPSPLQASCANQTDDSDTSSDSKQCAHPR